jgi:hypothetical protein
MAAVALGRHTEEDRARRSDKKAQGHDLSRSLGVGEIAYDRLHGRVQIKISRCDDAKKDRIGMEREGQITGHDRRRKALKADKEVQNRDDTQKNPPIGLEMQHGLHLSSRIVFCL